MNKEKTTGNKGITLIALIITIIVMLILVTVSITMAVKGGLFKYASDAGKKTNEAIRKEGELADLEEGLSVDQLIEKYSGINAGVVAGNPNKFYGATVTGYTWPNQNNEDITWRIFHSDGQNIYLIASDYVKNVPDSENNSIYVNDTDYQLSMNDVINDYSGGADIASSKAKKWIEDYLDSECVNMCATAYILDNSIWDILYKGTNAEYSIGAPTLKMFAESYNLTHEDKISYDEKNYCGYKVKLGNGTYAYRLEGLDSKNDLYYVIDDSKAYSMWLASPSWADEDYVLVVNLDGSLHEDGLWSNEGIGFRPVVCLKSDVLLESVTDGEKTTYKIK